ncbi:MAG: DUF5522 domain-containing protein [Myxococcota bacterium]
MGPRRTRLTRTARTPDAVQIALHEKAVALGRTFYVDPRNGLYVFTALGLKEQGSCCGTGCMHCPFPADQQLRAGRPQ